MNPPLKTIQYSQGYASFRIPQNWVEEVEKDGRLHFYDDVSEDIFSLRFNILTIAPPFDLSNAQTEDVLSACNIPEQAEKVMIDSKNMIAMYHVKESREDEGNYIHYFYEYVHKNSKGTFDLAVFIWAIEERLENEITYLNFRSMIEEEAKGLKFKD